MFNAKLHDEEDDELPRYEEEEDEGEGAEQPHEGTIEIEEIAIESEDGDEDSAESPAPRKLRSKIETGQKACSQEESQIQEQAQT